MSLQNFIAKVGPTVSAAWLNAVDVLKFTIFEDALTKADARANLTSDDPLEVANGGTGVRSLDALAAAFGAGFGPAQAYSTTGATLNLGLIPTRNVLVAGAGATTTSFGSAASVNSPIYLVMFSTSTTLVHSVSLQLPGYTNIVTASGDYLLAQYMGSSNWKVIFYQKESDIPGTVAALRSGTTAELTFILKNFAGSTDGKLWTFVPDGDALCLYAHTDAMGFITSVLKIGRTGATVTSFELPSYTQLEGVPYYLRTWISQASSLNIPPAYARISGTYHPAAGGAGDIYTIVDSDFAIGTTLHFANLDSNALSIACSGATLHLAGTASTGTRSLAEYGRAWAEKITSGVWIIHGYGLT